MTCPRCVICGRECIPLADYEIPTCIACDDTMEIIGEAAFVVSAGHGSRDDWQALEAERLAVAFAVEQANRADRDSYDRAMRAIERGYARRFIQPVPSRAAAARQLHSIDVANWRVA